MNILVCALALIAVASARPDVSELSGSYLPSSGGSNILSTSFPSQPSGSYLPGSIGGGSNILSTSFGSNDGYSGGIHGINTGFNRNYVQDQKHVYFYAAPDDEAPARFRVNIAPSSHRNTKIIFVKAPSYGGIIPEVHAPHSQHEDKTLVYVLVKKQQHGGAVTIPSGLGVKQTKPEVFFIKYRNQNDVEQVVNGGLGEQHVGSNLHNLGDARSFINSLSTGRYAGYNNGGGVFGNTGDSGSILTGSSLLGATSTGIGGSPGGIYSGIDTGIMTARYGAPGASGPYKR